ncbi:MAG: hypothetical protein IT374_26545 [Polyangiaceae bacterium]|nr:hypothetical protein [Polyangiaceae bacterium]
MGDDREHDEDEAPRSRTGRFLLAHRAGGRVEVGEPIFVGGDSPWLCAVKLLGRESPDVEGEPTQTLMVRSGRGATPEEAQRAAMAALSLVYGTPVGPAPSTLISRLPSHPPPPRAPHAEQEPQEPKSGWLQRIFQRKVGSKR